MYTLRVQWDDTIVVEGERGTIAFTPKEHTEYEGVKQTMILRIKTS